MKPATILVASCIGLAVCGMTLAFSGSRVERSNLASLGIDFSEPRHAVTDSMEMRAKKLASKVAPTFALTAVDGTRVAIAPAGISKPQFVYFVKNGCPCSYDAEPLFQRLYKHLGGTVDFIAVFEGTKQEAQRWENDLSVPYPVLPNPTLEVMTAFSADRSVYSALIEKGGRIRKLWPGFSKSIMTDMNEVMANSAGKTSTPFDVKFAPDQKTSGCSFDAEIYEKENEALKKAGRL